MVELKPCPLCGGKAELWKAHAENPKRQAWIACMGRCCTFIAKEHPTDGAAIAAWNRRTEALSRTGAVKVPSGEIEDIVSDLEYWSERLADMRQPQGQSSLKHAASILSALEPAARETSPVASHETANVRGKPAAPEAQQEPHEVLHVYDGDGGVIIRENGNISTFGAQTPAVLAAFESADTPEAQQEPVAWMWEEVVDPSGDVIHGGTITRFATHWSTPPSYADVTPLYPRPAEQAVTEAMVEAAAIAISGGRKDLWDGFDLFKRASFRTRAMHALKAAMEAGG